MMCLLLSATISNMLTRTDIICLFDIIEAYFVTLSITMKAASCFI